MRLLTLWNASHAAFTGHLSRPRTKKAVQQGALRKAERGAEHTDSGYECQAGEREGGNGLSTSLTPCFTTPFLYSSYHALTVSSKP